MTRARDLSRFTNPSAVSVEAGTFNIGIGSTSPDVKLDVIGSIEASGIITAAQFFGDGSGLTGVASTDNILTNAIDVSGISTFGVVLVGHSSEVGRNYVQIQGDSDNGDNGVGGISLRRGVALGSIGDGSQLGQIDFGMSDGGVAARILVDAEGAAGTDDYPGRIEFYTTADGSGTPTERLRISSTGEINTTEDLQIGTQASHTKELRFADSTRDDASSILVDNSDSSNLKITNDRSGASIVFATDSVERARIGSTGNVGFNTDQFSGNQTIQIAGELLTSSSNLTSQGLMFQPFTTAGTGDVYPGITWSGNVGALTRSRAAITVVSTGTVATASDLVFMTRSAADASSIDVISDEKLRITSDGRIGIGSTSPDGILVVQGNSNDNTNPSIRLKDGADTREVSITNSSGDFVAATHGLDNSHHGQVKIFENGRVSLFTGGDGGSLTELVRVGSGQSVAFLPSNSNLNAIKRYGFGQGRTPAASANTNSTTLSDQVASTMLCSSLQNTNNEGGHSALLIHDSGGAAVTPGDLIKAYRSTSLRFMVKNDGDCENVNNSYTGISDQRLKQDITDAGSAWDDIKSIRVRKFRFIEDVERHTEHPHLGEAPYLLGVVAQEVETISPGLIRQNKLDDGSPDPDAMKSVKYSILYMKAVKALQEAQTRIETLETTVTTLSDRITALES